MVGGRRDWVGAGGGICGFGWGPIRAGLGGGRLALGEAGRRGEHAGFGVLLAASGGPRPSGGVG